MKLALILLAAFAAFVTAAALCDVVPAARTWLCRIGIGSLPPQAARNKMRAAAVRQLRKTPAVPIGDGTRFTLPERLRGTYKSRKVQSWQRAALLLGVAESGDAASVRACAQDGNSPSNASTRRCWLTRCCARPVPRRKRVPRWTQCTRC